MKRIILVTGAAKGIGHAITLAFNELYNSDTLFLIIDRNGDILDETKLKLLNESNSRNQVECIDIDFGDDLLVENYNEILASNLPDAEELKSYEEIICVYNHGTLEVGTIVDMAQNDLRHKFQVNVFSIWSLLAAIQLTIPVTVIPKQTHVNMASGYGLEPAANWSGHCCTRASREMLFKCLALENPELRVLNYQPGIVLTDMFMKAADHCPEYKEILESQKFTTPVDTAEYLVKIIDKNDFVSGSRKVYMQD